MRVRRRGLATSASAALALAVFACDFARVEDGGFPTEVSTPSPPAAQARLSALILPNPVVVLRDPRAPSAKSARWTLYITESGGVGGSVTFVNATIRDADTGTPVEPQASLSLDGSEIRHLAGTDRLPPGGTLAVPESLDYESATPRATLTIAVQFLDDHGNVVSQSATARLE